MGHGGRRTFASRKHYCSQRISAMDLGASSSSKSRSSSSSKSRSSSSSSDASFIHHNVSRLDTLAGIAIKYGVEVADIKRLNGLTTDLQMFARKTLRIPSQGRHAPSEQHLQDSNGHLAADFQPRLGKHYFTPTCGSDNEFNVGKRKVSSAMGLLRGYYGLASQSRDAEGTEMEVYRTESSGGGYQSEDEPFTPRENLSRSKLKPPADPVAESSEGATPGVSTFNSMVSMARDFVVGEIEKAAVRRRPKGDNSVEDKQEFFPGGKSSIPRPRSSGPQQASRFGVEIEVDCPTVRALVFNGSGSGGKGKSVSGNVVEELIFKLKKSSSTPNLEDEKQPLIQKNGRPDVAVLSSGPAAAAAAAGIPLLDSLTRRSKTALD